MCHTRVSELCVYHEALSKNCAQGTLRIHSCLNDKYFVVKLLSGSNERVYMCRANTKRSAGRLLKSDYF